MQYKIKITELPLFNYISPSFSKELVKTFSIIKKKKDEIILHYGDEVSGLYLIAEGEIDVIARTSDIYITTLEKGSTFGEMSLLENETSSATLKAKTDVVILLCKREEFNRLLSENFVSPCPDQPYSALSQDTSALRRALSKTRSSQDIQSRQALL